MSQKKLSPLKVLHTSDWHLGRRLYGNTRYQEFSSFLNWLYECIIEQSIDILIVAGDIFDTMTPSNKAQTLYYEFLSKISNSVCKHVIIVAGNHDSPSLLDAPKELLKFLNVHIIGTACENIEDEVITLKNDDGEAQAIILAVPYLRDKDVRQSTAGESGSNKQQQVVNGITDHYAKAANIAKAKHSELTNINAQTASNISVSQETSASIPIIATGHLMAVGGKTTSDDGVRDLYVGSLGGISANIFDPAIDYVALGHLHVPQLVGGHEHIRYSGSPIPMGFGEANDQKQVLLIEFDDKKTINAIKVPCFHKLAQIKGDLNAIKQKITDLNKSVAITETVWVEVIYQSDEVVGNLIEKLNEMVTNSAIEIIKIKNTQSYQHVLNQSEQSESLHDLTHYEVFARCLDTHEVADSQRDELTACFQEIVYEVENEDVRAE